MRHRKTEPSVPRVIVVASPEALKDATIAKLTARAELVLEELDATVKQMSAMLKETVK